MASGKNTNLNYVKLYMLAGLFLLGIPSRAQTPTVFFTDLVSGPNNGGEHNKGTILSIYGKKFGLERGSSSVSIGGSPVSTYISWGHQVAGIEGLQVISVAIGSRVVTGPVVVHSAAGDSNTDVNFTVRPGKIYCVATDGDDRGPGTFAKGCWKTLAKAIHAIAPGDIIYAMTGVMQVAEDEQAHYSAALSLTISGSEMKPLALIAYPGATVSIGNDLTTEYGIRFPSISTGPFNYWVIAGLHIRATQALNLPWAKGTRIIGNDISCAAPDGQMTACLESDNGTQITIEGNHLHDIGGPKTGKTYHALYLSTDANHAWIGWNTIENVQGCRAIQFYSSGGKGQYDLHVHDNVIHDVRCDAINFSTVDPSAGPVEAYNNVIYHVGTGPDASDGEANYACINVNSADGKSTDGFTDIYNNTLYDCGARGGDTSGAITAAIAVRLRNNLIYLMPGETLVGHHAGCDPLVGATNLIWGRNAKDCPKLAKTVLSEPKFANQKNFDFHLRPDSPGVKRAFAGPRWNFDGVPLGKNSAVNIGAY